MKIAISSTGETLASKVDPRFGRAPYFVIVEERPEDCLKIDALKNTAADAAMGAGTDAAQQVVRERIEAVISGAVGPNAFEIFEKLGVEVFLARGDMSVKEAYEQFKQGALQRMRIKRL